MMEVMAKPASPRERKAAQLIRRGCTGEITGKKRGNDRIVLQAVVLGWLCVSGMGVSAKSLLHRQLLGVKLPISQPGPTTRSNKHQALCGCPCG